jgi:nitric oxide reductase large subunit
MNQYNTFIILFLLFTFFMMYVGLWSELTSRIKFNQWDIIGAHGRVTNHNLYSNLYILGIVFIVIILYFKHLIRRYLK